MAEGDMDETDRRIVQCLQGDARNVTTADIGEEIGVSGSTVANRISRLEEWGVIEGYAPIIDYERTGRDQHHLFVGTIHGEDADGVRDAIGDETGVVAVTTLVGDRRNVVVEAVGEHQTDLERVADALSELGVTVERTAMVTGRVDRAFDDVDDRTDSDG